MGIYIPNMEMPKTCCQCDLKIYDNEMRWDENSIEQIGAWVCKRTREIIWNTQRGENCPIVPLPEKHGRLIDADDMQSIINTMKAEAVMDGLRGVHPDITHYMLMQEMLEDAETIIEAEGGGEDG